MKRVTRSSSRPKDAPSAEPEVAAKKPAKAKPAKKAAAAKIEEADEDVNVDLPGTVEVEVQKNSKKAAVDKKKSDQAKPNDIQEESDAKKSTTAGKKRAPAKKSAKSDDDDEEQSSPAKKPKSTAAAAKKIAKKPTKSSEDDEDEEMPAKVESPKKKNDTKTDYGKIQFESSENFNFKIATWNVAGLRALANKNTDYIDQEKPDVICFNEIRCTEDEVPEEFKPDGYHAYWNIGKGFGGVGMLTKVEPLSIVNDIPDSEFSDQKRMITAEFDKFYLISVYVVNAGRGLKTLDKRLAFNEVFDEYVKKLDKKKPVIIAGDMNVSHQEIDLKNPKSNKKNAGFSDEERAGFSKLLSLGFVDTFRELYPDQRDAYTFWSYMANARAKNVGWRLDYFLVSQRFAKNVKDNIIRSEVMGSDHCPIVLLLSL